MPIVRPLSVFCDTGRFTELCRQKNEQVFLTHEESEQLVVMSKETYEKQLGLLEIYRKLFAAEKQLEEGVPLQEGDEVFRKLRAKHE